MNPSTLLKDLDLIAFDTETSGAYPLQSEICEIAAVRWRDSQIVDQFQSFVKVTKPMSDFIISIHGITNKMIADAPLPIDVFHQFHKFIQGAVLVAHHAPFDIGFLTYEFEKFGLAIPTVPALCSSLLTQKIFPESKNHKLQTLIEFFGMSKGTAHRALDDSKACLDVTLRCFEKLGWESTLQSAYDTQIKNLRWKDFSIYTLLSDGKWTAVVGAIQAGKHLDLSYRHSNDNRTVKPLGIVRSPDGDYLVANEGVEERKRFYLKRIVAAKPSVF